MNYSPYIHQYGPSFSVHERTPFLPEIQRVLSSSQDSSLMFPLSAQDIRLLLPPTSCQTEM